MKSRQEAIKRLKIIEGHLKKVREMIEEDTYCPHILTQSAAVQSALKKVDEVLLQGHLEHCVKNALQKGSGEKEIKELLEAFKQR